MRDFLNRLWKDSSGMILSAEVVLIGTILVLGSVVGLVSVSHAVTHELNDIASAWMAQSSSGPREASVISDSAGIPEMAGQQ